MIRGKLCDTTHHTTYTAARLSTLAFAVVVALLLDAHLCTGQPRNVTTKLAAFGYVRFSQALQKYHQLTHGHQRLGSLQWRDESQLSVKHAYSYMRDVLSVSNAKVGTIARARTTTLNVFHEQFTSERLFYRLLHIPCGRS